MHAATLPRTAARPAAPSHPSPLRIGALSGAIGLHAVALIAMTLLRQADAPAVSVPKPSPIQVDMIERVAPTPTPTPPMPVAPPRPVQRVVAPVVPVAVQVPEVESAWVTDQVVSPPVDAYPSDTAAVVSAPAGAPRVALRYVTAPPPKYPPIARKRNWTGEVMLRVLVGLDGRPLNVEIESSSGHDLLDRQAREHVLKAWRFEPAQVDGRAVKAWGRVPINFAIY